MQRAQTYNTRNKGNGESVQTPPGSDAVHDERPAPVESPSLSRLNAGAPGVAML